MPCSRRRPRRLWSAAPESARPPPAAPPAGPPRCLRAAPTPAAGCPAAGRRDAPRRAAGQQRGGGRRPDLPRAGLGSAAALPASLLAPLPAAAPASSVAGARRCLRNVTLRRPCEPSGSAARPGPGAAGWVGVPRARWSAGQEGDAQPRRGGLVGRQAGPAAAGRRRKPLESRRLRPALVCKRQAARRAREPGPGGRNVSVSSSVFLNSCVSEGLLRN